MSYQVKQIAHKAMETENLRWLFLTLTKRSVTGDKLSEEIDHYVKSFRKLFQRKKFKNSVLGFFRALEITYNKEADTYHPHYHILLAVKPSYFDGQNYISKKGWAKLWQEVAQLDYEPIVDVRAVKSGRRMKKESKMLAEKGYIEPGVIAEMSKYTVKSGDYLIKGNNNLTDEIVNTLDNALRGRRLFAFGGLLKEIYKQLEKEKKIEDAESEKANLTHISDELQGCTCPTCNSTLLEVMYQWCPNRKGYYKVDL